MATGLGTVDGARLVGKLAELGGPGTADGGDRN
jgi:hypothetical protein